MANGPGVLVSLDVQRVPKGDLSATAFVAELVLYDDSVERHYLEAKSDIDLTTKAGLAKLAKFILGASNRMPDVAAQAFEGHAVMAVGISKDNLVGIPKIEVLEIQKGVQPFLTSAGPRWDVLRVPVADADREVLLVIVAPPQWGEPAYLCHKDGEAGLRDGAVFIRAEGETRLAKADEMKQLQSRGQRTAQAVELEVEIVGEAIRFVCDRTQTLDVYLADTEARLNLAKTLDGQRGRGQYGILIGTSPETRSANEYSKQISDWVRASIEGWEAGLDRIAATLFDGIAIRVTNREQVYLSDVEVSIHLEGDVDAVRWRTREDNLGFDMLLDEPPRPWGPQPLRLDYNFPVPNYITALNDRPFSPNPVSFKNSGSVDITVKLGDLRPAQTYTSDDDDMVLLLRSDVEGPIRGTWSLTAKDHHALYQGELNVVVGPRRDFTSGIRAILLNEDSD